MAKSPNKPKPSPKPDAGTSEGIVKLTGTVIPFSRSGPDATYGDRITGSVTETQRPTKPDSPPPSSPPKKTGGSK